MASANKSDDLYDRAASRTYPLLVLERQRLS